MDREPEPELMDEEAQVRAYAEADFSAAHDLFVDLLRDRLAGRQPQTALDLGCGPCDVTRRFARAFPFCAITAVDAAPRMLAEAAVRNERAGLAQRIALVEARLPAAALEGRRYDLVLSNSLLHHLPEPGILWHAVRDAAAPGGFAFAMDLLRPATPEDALALVETYARDEAEILRRDFHRSLHAAYRPDEVEAQLASAGLRELRVEVTSDRHWIAFGAIGGSRAPRIAP